MSRAALPAGAVLMLVAFAAAVPSAAEEGQSMFGENRRETIEAMKEIVKALGVENCQFCHVKQRGRPRFDLETPNKKIARQMKVDFVDSLAAKGTATLTITEESHEETLSAVYRAEGDSAGIELATVGENEDTRTVWLPLPEDGSRINCSTCHQGQVHVLPRPAEE